MIKKIILIGIFIFLFIPTIVYAEEKEVNLYLFYGKGCPHCAAEEEALVDIQAEFPSLHIYTYETWYNTENQVKLEQVGKILKKNITNVPLTVIGNKYFVGYSESIKQEIIDAIKLHIAHDYEDKVGVKLGVLDNKNVNNGGGVHKIHENKKTFTLPVIGEIDAKSVSLPLISIFVGLIDGFNPCAMWVLLFLVGMLINMKDKKKSWWIGITFLVASAITYLFFMLAILNITTYIGNVIYMRYLIATVALIGGILSIKSGVKKETGCEVIDEKKRKKFVHQIKDIIKQQSLPLAIVGVAILAISVNMVDALCSAGLPAIFMQILALNNLSTFQYAIYIFLYLLFFLIVDIIVFIIAMKTLNVRVVSNKFGKLSHIVGGTILLIIAILMVLKPEWLMFNF